jgi:hypothetical protein
VGQRTLNDLGSELQGALAELELDDPRVSVSASEPAGGTAGSLVLMVDGVTLPVAVLHRADFRPVHASELPALGRHEAGMVFADRIAERTRETLRERGWGWLDRRRGHLRLWQPGLRIDADITPRVMTESGPRARNPFTPAGITLALWLLVHPHEPASPRGLARELAISPGQVSNLLAALETHALLRRDRRPLVPELFWALVEEWRPRRYPLLTWPPPEGLGAPELRVDEWVVTDAVAAAHHGAPIVVAGEAPPDLYVPSDDVLRWVLHRLPAAPEYEKRAASIAVAPTPLVCDPRLHRPAGRDTGGFDVAHPVVAALDLGTDRARGREAVSDWEPQADLGVARVW